MYDGFKLKSPGENFNLFISTDPTRPQKSDTELVEIGVNLLTEYDNQKFPLYSGQKFTDMVESIKANGILTPLLVRPVENEKGVYQIIAGRNRRRTAIEAGLQTVPCIIREDLSEEDVHVMVYETNIHQQSFMDFSHSVRAAILADHYNALKKQGRRNDLINTTSSVDIESEPDNPGRTDQKLGQEYGITKDKVWRYILADRLIPEFKELLDAETLKLSPAALLSHLTNDEQLLVFNYITENNLKIIGIQAAKLKELSEKKRLNTKNLKELFRGKKDAKPGNPKPVIQLKRKAIQSFFPENEPEEKIQATIFEALTFFFEHQAQSKAQANMKGGEENTQSGTTLEATK